MVLFYILCLIVLLIGYWGWKEDGFNGLSAGLFFGGMIASCIFLGVQVIGQSITDKHEDVTFPLQLASLNDGTEVKGTGGGGLFVSSMRIQDTQHFAYYRKTDTGGYVLEKRDANASTIYTDATQETARVEITDDKVTCQDSWWIVCFSDKPRQTFKHANFHIPPGSIKEEFNLDAQ